MKSCLTLSYLPVRLWTVKSIDFSLASEVLWIFSEIFHEFSSIKEFLHHKFQKLLFVMFFNKFISPFTDFNISANSATSLLFALPHNVEKYGI